MIVDWTSCRSQRVCRSTLATASCAANEAGDRSAYINIFLGEVLYDIPAHRIGSRLHSISVTDANSLYDVVISDMPNLSDRCSLVNIRAIQEVVSADQFHWIPTRLMWPDALTKQRLELQLTMHYSNTEAVVQTEAYAIHQQNNTSVKFQRALDMHVRSLDCMSIWS